MIRIAIVEDEKVYAEQLQEYLKQYEAEYEETFTLQLFQDGDEIVEGYRPEYDLILMDIQMKFVDGMTAAEQIRKMDKDVLIIFITNMAQYAIRGYEVSAFDFILKPVTYFAFSQKLKRAVQQCRQQEKKYMTIRVAGGIARIALDQINYMESMKHQIIVHTETEEYTMTGTMKELEEQLAAEHFFRCNSGYLVNLAKVRRVNGNEVLAGTDVLAISRPRRKAFMAALTDYMGEVRI